MATRILNQDRVVELLKKYRPTLTLGKAGGGTSVIKFLCPFHPDTNPSYSFFCGTDKGTCFSCKKSATLVDLVMQFEQTSSEKAKKLIVSCYDRVSHADVKKRGHLIDVSLAQIEMWHKALETDLKLMTLITKWGWTTALAEHFLLGSSDGRLTIPMFEDECIVGLKFYSPNNTSMKYQNIAGSASCCWPLANLASDQVYLVEGEKDCLTMLAAGLNAVTFTTGAGKFATAYIRYFAGKEVDIIYDIDEAGRAGAVAVANALGHASKNIKIIDLPLQGKPKGDLTDLYMQDPENFAATIETLRRNTENYQPPAAISRVVVPAEVHKTYLEDIVNDKLFYKRVSLKARVINTSQHETTVIPKNVLLTCNKDYKDGVCSCCPLFFNNEGIALHVRPEYPEIMSMVGNNDKVKREAIRSMVGVAEGCPKFRVEQKESQALHPIVVIPSIEADKKNHNYSMICAWALDKPIQENEDYAMEGVVLASPETQKLEIVFYKMEKDTSSVDSFELSEEMIERLKVFQCL